MRLLLDTCVWGKATGKAVGSGMFDTSAIMGTESFPARTG